VTVEPAVTVGAGQPPGGITPGMVREMFLRGDVQQTGQVVAGLASKIFRCDAAAVLLVQHDVITPTAVTDSAAGRASELQLVCSEGPSVDAVSGRRHSVVDDLRAESRWRFWSPQAAQLGWRSVVSVSLADEHILGVVSLYSRRPHGFTAEDLALLEVFAQHAALAITIADDHVQLRRAVEARTLIGQAQGVLMQRYQIDAEQAFVVMRRYSSHGNRKLRRVAEDIVRDRCLSAPPALEPNREEPDRDRPAV
jgi:transcriptional regulator with GAF, ATPase, and Fis domain